MKSSNHEIMKRYLTLFLLFPAMAAWAQQPLPEHVVEVDGPLANAIDAQVQTVQEGGRAEVLKMSNVLIYPFGMYQPVLSCTILRACIIELQQGEVVISLIAGDEARWLIEQTATGAMADVSLISIKPLDYNLTTNLIVSTNRRIYHITLDSPPQEKANADQNPLESYTRHMRFYYPEDRMAMMRENASLAQMRDGALPVATMPGAAHNYDYEWSVGDGFPWKPLAVFDDGQRVYIRLPAEAWSMERPTISVDRGTGEQVVDFLFRDGFYVIPMLFDRARLVLYGEKKNWRGKKKQLPLFVEISPVR